MKYVISLIAVGLLYVAVYGLTSSLTREASFAILGGVLVFFGMSAMGIVAIFLVAVMRKEFKSRDSYAPQPPIFMMTGGQPQIGADFNQYSPQSPMPQHYLPLPKSRDVEVDEW